MVLFQKEEEDELRKFRASLVPQNRPAPPTTYAAEVVVLKTLPLTVPESPVLHTKARKEKADK